MTLRPWSSFALAISTSDQETFELNELVFAHLERLAEGILAVLCPVRFPIDRTS